MGLDAGAGIWIVGGGGPRYISRLLTAFPDAIHCEIRSCTKEARMPGLLRGVARTAVVAGTATAVSNRVSRRQANRWADQEQQQSYEQQQQYAAPPQYAPAPPAPGPDPIGQLKELGELKAQGILTDEEFAAAKAKILAS
jgi:hypothetical protein